MFIINIKNLKKSFGERLLFDIDSLRIYNDDRVGIVGINGAGKSTLLKIICGSIKPDEGICEVFGKINYVPQFDEGNCKMIDSYFAKKFGTEIEYYKEMSGGEKTRYRIAACFKDDPDIILCDEPTSNLDIYGIEMLEEELRKYNGTIVVISHDRQFLDNICNKIIEIENGNVKVYNGNYSSYVEQKENERLNQKNEYDKYIDTKRRIETAIIECKEKSRHIRKAPKRMGNSEARLCRMGDQKAKHSIDKSVKAMKSRIEHLDVKEKPDEIPEVKFFIDERNDFYSQYPIEGKKINKSFGKKVIFKNAQFHLIKNSKTGLIGKNGCGKTTLINMILQGTSEINLAKGVNIAAFSQNIDNLNDDETVIDNIKKDSIYDESFIRILLSRMMIGRDDVHKKVKILSGGERVKVSLCKVLASSSNIIILDEPTNYLDIYSLEALEESLSNINKTVLVVSHDRKFISKVCERLLIIENFKIKNFEGTFEEYENTKIAKHKNLNTENENKKLILKNRLSAIISLISINSTKMNQSELNKLNCEYELVLKELKNLE